MGDGRDRRATRPSPGDAPAIETSGLTKKFGSTRAVDGVDLTVPRGSVYAVLGPNGAGKTTTVRMLATLERPDAGSACVFGHDVVGDAVRVRSMIGLTGQYATVDNELTAAQNLMIFSRLHGQSRAAARRRAHELLERFGLDEVAARKVRTFSGGMRRRLDLAAGLVARPPLLFLDEPTTGLDPRTRVQMWDTVRELVHDGATVLLTTQYLEEADNLADRIAVIDRGAVVAEGTADQLKDTIGSSTLVITLTDPDSSAVARAVLSTRLATSAVVVDGDTVSVALPEVDAVGGLLVALGDAGVGLSGMAVTRPTLDDVFFAITGAAVTTPAPADVEEAQRAPA